MKIGVAAAFVSALLSAGAAHTAAAQAGYADGNVARDLGAVLGWRLGPETVVAHCRGVDAGGVAARDKLLADWNSQNDALIKAVDARVAEVVSLLDSKTSPEALIASLREQVSQLVIEATFSGKTADEARALCETETDPSRPRWKNAGIRGVRQSLAALYDWKVAHSQQ